VSSQPDPSWVHALRDDGDRQEWRFLFSRSRHAHPVLYWLMIGSVVGSGLLRWLGQEHGGQTWALWLWLGLLALALSCLVLLIRRDELPPGR
jgi:hypothetical protein